MRRDQHERVLAFVVKAQDLVGLGKEHAEDAPFRDDRHSDLAMRRAETGERNACWLLLQKPGAPCSRAEGGAVAVFGTQMTDPDRHAFACGDADDALARQDLGADARYRITPRSEREKPSVALGDQEHGVGDPEVPRHSVEHGVCQVIEVTAACEIVDTGPNRRQERQAPAGRRRRGRQDLLDPDHAEDVRAEKPEDLLEPVMRGDAGELCLHRLEERPRGARFDVVEIQPVKRERAGIEKLHAGLPRREQVRPWSC